MTSKFRNVGKTLVILLFIVVLGVVSAIVYSATSSGIKTQMTFTQNPSRVIETRDKANKETVIVFLNPTCGHCQDAYPKIVKAAGSQRTKAQNIATVYVNAKDDKNKSLLKKYDVNNTPTLIQDVGGNVSVPISLVKYGEIDNDVIKNVYRQ